MDGTMDRTIDEEIDGEIDGANRTGSKVPGGVRSLAFPFRKWSEGVRGSVRTPSLVRSGDQVATSVNRAK